MLIKTRREILAGSAALAATLSLPALAAARTFRVGYQPYGNLMLLKVSGFLEERLKPLGWDVSWSRFVSGPPLMEALAAGAIDFGSAGETPPIFAQAAGARIVYQGAEPPAPRGEAILVLDKSPIRSVADLKDKKVAFNKGSNVHYLYVKALEQAKLQPTDVTPVYLAPADGRAAFERGSVDAWVIWDPFLASAQASGHARVLVDGTGLVANHQFYLSQRAFTDQAVLDATRDAIKEIDRRTVRDPGASASILAPEIGLPQSVVTRALTRQGWDIRPMDKSFVDAQQVIADRFHALHLLGKDVQISQALPTT